MTKFVGIDPGGKAAMGWCVATVDRLGLTLKTGVCTGVGKCLESIDAELRGAPTAIGIDAPLYWTERGDRVSDREIRKAVVAARGHAGTVGHVNSLRGACLVQGVLAAVSIGKRWPDTPITESHPKALLHVSPESRAFVQDHRFTNEHERDAALGAYAARAMFEHWPGWTNWLDREHEPFAPSGGAVAYWFPNC